MASTTLMRCYVLNRAATSNDGSSPQRHIIIGREVFLIEPPVQERVTFQAFEGNSVNLRRWISPTKQMRLLLQRASQSDDALQILKCCAGSNVRGKIWPITLLRR